MGIAQHFVSIRPGWGSGECTRAQPESRNHSRTASTKTGQRTHAHDGGRGGLCILHGVAEKPTMKVDTRRGGDPHDKMEKMGGKQKRGGRAAVGTGVPPQ